ncbi:diguanylate cyclase (GGDEF)-like protein [Fictibacillus halophilus]|uniref:Diguanylate cyclase (GGDEF)-like protein n=1 Tax=Fictibacillus halophilus TaxID=1610490 RepID=A0ABV2LI17_9BACL|nr:GGDEF domain-containing protein [Fictibacillus halophilus]
MNTSIGKILENAPFVHPETRGAEIDQMFKEDTELEGIVVTNRNIPIGLVTRSHFYQKLGTLYGFNVFIGRPVKLIMNVEPLIVDYSMPLSEVSTLAMKRKKEQLYDFVIITKNSEFLGIVSIKNLLIQLAEVQSMMARYLNPLTGLPGNKMIDQKLSEIISEMPFSLLYLDLDFFKTYNDTYGFHEGDRLIQETASIIKEAVLHHKDSFVGHIGGDDFMCILNHYEYSELCKKIIAMFNRSLPRFYKEEDWLRGFVHNENRSGIKEHIPLVSLSIAVVTNEKQNFNSISEIIDMATVLKKKCKQLQSSAYISNTDLIKN